MKKLLSLLALAVAMSTGTAARASDGPCYDACKDAYDKCTRTYGCYLAYCACVAACDDSGGGAPGDGKNQQKIGWEF